LFAKFQTLEGLKDASRSYTLINFYRIEITFRYTSSAIYTGILIDKMNFFFASVDAINRAVYCT